MASLDRRRFLTAAGAATFVSVLPRARVLGANDDVRLAVIGCGGRGGGMIGTWQKVKGCRVVALADPDSKTLARRAAGVEKDTGEKPIAEADFRRILERDDVDAVYIASPNHWHALQTILACQAGKDVYVEKPVSHTIWEGRQAVAAAEKYGRMVQAGTQNRSDTGLLKAFPWLQEGNLGKITMLRGLCYRDRNSIGKRDTPLTPPAEVDYNLWLGPAADIPIMRPRFHYDWHWVWNTGNGDVGNQGPHETDLICWALGDPALPKHVLSFGGRFGWDDAGDTPNMQFVFFDYPGVPAYFEVRNLQNARGEKGMPNYRGRGNTGVIIDCEGGWVIGGRGGAKAYNKDGQVVQEFKGDGGNGHYQNFIDAVKSRRSSDLRAPIARSHVSSAMSHMANISYRVGGKVTPDELRERLSGDAEALDALGRFTEQLGKWDIDFGKEPWTLGAPLTVVDGEERFGGETLVAEANALLRREDRAPWVVPDKV